jgi:hypothetical protein
MRLGRQNESNLSMRMTVTCALAAVLVFAVVALTRQQDPALTVSAADREIEAARLKSLGADLSKGNPVLERPWDPPYTRRSFVVPQAWFLTRPPDSVSADALRADLPILASVMERAYGGWDVAKKRGWSWDRWFADWSAMLRRQSGRSLALADAFAPMKQLMAFQLDNHTTIPLRGARFGSGSQSIVIDGSPAAQCTEFMTVSGAHVTLDVNDPSQRPRRAKRWVASASTLEPVTYISLPANRGTPTSIHCGDRWISATTAWPSGDVASLTPAEGAARAAVIRSFTGASLDEPNFAIIEPTIAYLRLPTFNERNGALIEQRVASWPKPTGNERVLIVDLRANDGGNSNIALRPLVGWVDMRRAQRAQATHRREGASCLYHALRWGYTTASTPPVSASMTQRLQNSIDELFQPSAAGCPSEFKDSNSDWDFRQHAMQPPGKVDGHLRVLALVDNGCGSDCEYMTLQLSSLPETVIVGSNTFGVAQFIQPGYSVLPHTRLPFRVALGMSDGYGDNRSFDGYGYDVDILLTTQEDQSRQNILALARYIGGH